MPSLVLRDPKAAVTSAIISEVKNLPPLVYLYASYLIKLFTDYPEILRADDINDCSGTVGKEWLNFEGEQ